MDYFSIEAALSDIDTNCGMEVAFKAYLKQPEGLLNKFKKKEREYNYFSFNLLKVINSKTDDPKKIAEAVAGRCFSEMHPDQGIEFQEYLRDIKSKSIDEVKEYYFTLATKLLTKAFNENMRDKGTSSGYELRRNLIAFIADAIKTEYGVPRAVEKIKTLKNPVITNTISSLNFDKFVIIFLIVINEEDSLKAIKELRSAGVDFKHDYLKVEHLNLYLKVIKRDYDDGKIKADALMSKYVTDGIISLLQKNYFYQNGTKVAPGVKADDLIDTVKSLNVNPSTESHMLFWDYLTKTKIDSSKPNQPTIENLIKLILAGDPELEKGITSTKQPNPLVKIYLNGETDLLSGLIDKGINPEAVNKEGESLVNYIEQEVLAKEKILKSIRNRSLARRPKIR